MSNQLSNIRALLALICIVLSTSAIAQDGAPDAAAEANNPLAQFTSLNFQNQFIGNLSEIDEPANSFLLRGAQPFQLFGGDWIARATLPVNTFPAPPDLSHETGLGDFNIFAAYLFDTGNPAISFGLGPQLTIPTATDDALGSGQWSTGLANVLFYSASPAWQLGYLLTWQASFAGDSDRSDVNIGAFQPFIFHQLGDGWYLRSSAVSTYDFETDNYSVPVGLGLGNVFQTESAVVNIFVEPQVSVFDDGPNQPEWGIFAGINFQFPR